VSRLYSLNFARHATELNLTLAQCKVCATCSVTRDLAGAAPFLTTRSMTLVRILDRMERDALIERRPDPADRRARGCICWRPRCPC